MTTSTPETIARYRKARAIADLVQIGYEQLEATSRLADMLRAATPQLRIQIAASAGQREPSDTTWNLVIEIVEREQSLRFQTESAAGDDVPAFTPGEEIMYVQGGSKDLVDSPATFLTTAGRFTDGEWRVRIRLESGDVREVHARRLYRRPAVGGARGHASAANAASGVR